MDSELLVLSLSAYVVNIVLISSKVQRLIGRRIAGIGYDSLIAITQMSPLFVGVLFFSENVNTYGIGFNNLLLSVILGILFGTVAIAIEYFPLNAKLLVSSEMLQMLPKIKLKHLLRRVAEGLVLAPVTEEVLYRGALQNALAPLLGFVSIIFSASLFFLQHFVDPLARRHYIDWRNRIFLFFEALSLGIIMYMSSSLVGCIIAHSLMNSVFVFGRIRKYLCFNEPH